jgi:hypothetical protein
LFFIFRLGKYLINTKQQYYNTYFFHYKIFTMKLMRLIYNYLPCAGYILLCTNILAMGNIVVSLTCTANLYSSFIEAVLKKCSCTHSSHRYETWVAKMRWCCISSVGTTGVLYYRGLCTGHSQADALDTGDPAEHLRQLRNTCSSGGFPSNTKLG